MPLSRELVTAVRSRIKERPDLPETELATELNASEVDVITALPVAMRRKAKTSDAGAIWTQATCWKNFRIAQGVRQDESESRSARVVSESAFSGDRIAALDIGSVWFVSRPPENDGSHAIHLYDKNGIRLVSLYLGRDRDGRIHPEDKAGFEAMREQYGITPQPGIRCKGCGACTCRKTRGNDSPPPATP